MSQGQAHSASPVLLSLKFSQRVSLNVVNGVRPAVKGAFWRPFLRYVVLRSVDFFVWYVLFVGFDFDSYLFNSGESRHAELRILYHVSEDLLVLKLDVQSRLEKSVLLCQFLL